MEDYKWLAKLGGEGYSKIARKIYDFNDSVNKFPNTVNELNSKFSLTESDKETLKHRGKLERKLNKIQNPELLLLRTYDKYDKKDERYLSDDNQIIYAKFSYILDKFLGNSDEDLGLHLINDDLFNRKNNKGIRALSANARILYIRPKNQPQLIKPICGGENSNNSGTLSIPFYQIQDIYSTPEEILDYCKKQGLKQGNLEKIKNLVSELTQNYLKKMDNSKVGITALEIEVVYSEFMN